MFDKSTALGKELFETIGKEDASIRDEFYCVFADNEFFSGNIREAISWQEKISSETTDKDLITHTKGL